MQYAYHAMRVLLLSGKTSVWAGLIGVIGRYSAMSNDDRLRRAVMDG
jgi:hypothetical protein